MEIFNLIKSIDLLPNDRLDYDLKLVLEYPNNRDRTSKISGVFDSHSEKDKFVTKLKEWRNHFPGWRMQPDEALEELNITKLQGIDANITDWPHFITSDGKAISAFKLVNYVLNEMPEA